MLLPETKSQFVLSDKTDITNMIWGISLIPSNLVLDIYVMTQVDNSIYMLFLLLPINDRGEIQRKKVYRICIQIYDEKGLEVEYT